MTTCARAIRSSWRHMHDRALGAWFGIYFFCLYLAYLTSFAAILLTFFFPFFGQLYWIWAVWMATGIFFNPLMIACLTWVGLGLLSATLLAAGHK